MLNSYVNNGKKKLVATTLALAVAFSSVASVSYKLSDSLCLNASATEVEQTQDDDLDVKIYLTRLSYIADKVYELDTEYVNLEDKLDTLAKVQPEAERVKSKIADSKAEFEKRMYAEYDPNDKNSMKSAICDIFGYTMMWCSGMKNIEGDVYSDIFGALLSEIGDCKTLEEAKALTERVINDGAVDDYIEENYGSKSEMEARMKEIEALAENLEKEEEEIKQNTELVAKAEKYQKKKALEEKRQALEEKLRTLQEEIESVDTELAELDNN